MTRAGFYCGLISLSTVRLPYGKCQDGNILVKTVSFLGFRQFPIERYRSFNLCFRPGQHLCRHLRCYSRPTEIPSALNAQTQFQSKSIRLLDGMLEKLTPLRCCEGRPCRNLPIASLICPASIKNQCPAKTLCFHFFQITGNRLFGNIAVKPPPETADARTLRWIDKAFFKRPIILRSINDADQNKPKREKTSK